jgi:hypothetical protein
VAVRRGRRAAPRELPGGLDAGALAGPGAAAQYQWWACQKPQALHGFP